MSKSRDTEYQKKPGRSVTPATAIREIVLWGFILEFALCVLLAATGLERSSPLLVFLFPLPFAVYLLTVWRMKKTQASAAQYLSFRKTCYLIIFFSLIFHVTVLFSSSILSNDIFRYYWDGKVLVHGFNPYIYAPDSDVLQFFRDANWFNVANRDVTTIYPPLAQLVFALSYRILPGILTLRLFSVLFSLFSALTLLLILRRLRLDPRSAIIYAWSPLVVIEFANSGHIDSLAILGVLLSFLALLNGKKVLSASIFALAVLAKFYPLLFAPLFLMRWGKRGAVAFAGVLALFYIPFLIADGTGIAGFFHYARFAQFNGSLFPLILSQFQVILGGAEAVTASKVAVFLVFLCFLMVLLWRFVRIREAEADTTTLWRYSFYLTGGFLLLSPTVHPWYLTWVLPFLCFYPSTAWLLFAGSVFLSRWVYVGYERTGIWVESQWIRLGEYLPVYLLLAKEWLERRKTNKNSISEYKPCARKL